MARVFASIVIGVLTGVLGLAASADASSFITGMRADCTPQSTSFNVRVGLYRDGTLIAEQPLDCVDGGVTTAEVVTSEEPNAWQVSGFGMCHAGDCRLICLKGPGGCPPRPCCVVRGARPARGPRAIAGRAGVAPIDPPDRAHEVERARMWASAEWGATSPSRRPDDAADDWQESLAAHEVLRALDLDTPAQAARSSSWRRDGNVR
jgi:hypothetical protein